MGQAFVDFIKGEFVSKPGGFRLPKTVGYSATAIEGANGFSALTVYCYEGRKRRVLTRKSSRDAKSLIEFAAKAIDGDRNRETL